MSAEKIIKNYTCDANLFIRNINFRIEGSAKCLEDWNIQNLSSRASSAKISSVTSAKIQVVCIFFDLSVSSVQSLSCAQLFVTPWTAAHQASVSITNSWGLLKLISIESMMPSYHLILCHPLLLSPLIIPSISVFSNESVLCIRWPKY